MSIDVSKGIDDGGGYDLKEIQKARESLSTKPQKVEKEVDPMYINVRAGIIRKTVDMGQRTIFIDYDEFGNIIGVELL